MLEPRTPTNSMIRHRRRKLVWLLGLLSLPMSLSSAEELRASSRAAASPEDVVRQFIDSVRLELQAIAKDDRAAAQAARARILAEWALPDPRPPEEQRRAAASANRNEEARNKIVDFWECVLAYYIDGLDLSAASATETAAEKGRELAEVQVPAAARGHAVVIRFHLLREDAGEWRVTLVDYLPPTKAKAASQPAAP